jgi:hypothetical protein
MDLRLAIVIVPQESNDPIEASRALLERLQQLFSRVHELLKDNAAIDRWSGEGGAASAPARPLEQADSPVPLAR